MGAKLLWKLLSGYFFRSYVVDDDATGSDVVGTGNDARLALYNSIADGNDKARAEELESVNEDGTTIPFDFDGENPPEGENPPLGDEVTPPEGEVTTPGNEPVPLDQPQKFAIKVNGQTIELTQEELIARAQKVESADQYLAEAARLYKDSRGAPASAIPPVQQPSVEDDDRALARAIQMGNEEEAINAIRRIRNAGPSPDDLTRTIDERLTFQEANRRFQSEFKEIVEDPRLYQMAIQMDASLVSKGDQRSYYDRYKAIGEDLMGWKKQIAASVPASTPTIQERQTRKEAVSPPPKPVAVRAPSTEVEEREPTTQEVIADMAKARGGPQWLRG